MDRQTAEQVLHIQELMQSESQMMSEYQTVHAAFLNMLDELSEYQRDVLMDYLGVCVEMHLWMLKHAIEKK